MGWLRDTIGPRLNIAAAFAAARAEAQMKQGAREIEIYAQTHAPWSDRTGNARYGLTAEVRNEGGEIVIELYHTVDYGQWLELIQDGRFAIIMPTLEALGPEILKRSGATVIDAPFLSGGVLG